jgi:hypothetical protein
MFIYIGDFFNDANIVWFKAIGNMRHYVATLFQQGKIDKKFIKSNQYNEDFEVALYNSNAYKFIPGDKYHLFLNDIGSNGFQLYMDIHIYTNEDKLVPYWLYAEIEEIKPNTWEELYKNKKNVIYPELLTNDDEYGIDNYWDEIESDDINQYVFDMEQRHKILLYTMYIDKLDIEDEYDLYHDNDNIDFI